MARSPLSVYLEVGSTKVFASAADWPGWCRAGKTEDAALQALESYADRYALVAAQAGVPFVAPTTLAVVDTVKGGSTTDFGAPEKTHAGEQVKLTKAKAKRLAALVQAGWDLLAEEARHAPAELRKGPRGGGRDRDKLLDHVIGAETAYARKLGVKHRQPALSDEAAIAALRADIVAVIGAPTDGRPVGEKGWTTAYAARRIAWHVLDHLWELQDKS
jgi:hypothetical protein